MGRETQFKFLGNRFEFKHLPGFSAPFGLRGFPHKKFGWLYNLFLTNIYKSEKVLVGMGGFLCLVLTQ